MIPLYLIRNAPVAQMDRACASGAQGRGFEPLRARHFFLTDYLFTVKAPSLQDAEGGHPPEGGTYVLTKFLAGIGALITLAVIGLVAQVRTDQVDRGGEWLSWSPGQRTTYVDGFITGYLQGSQIACYVSDELFEVGKPHRLGDQRDPGDLPSARCLARMEEYSKAKYTEGSGPDFTAYTGVITKFYTEHPEYRGIPFVNLMKSLSDRAYKTADQLYQMALKGELRPLR